MAWAPPALNTFVTPHKRAAYKIAVFIFPFLSGGVQSIISGHWAMRAGIASIKTVENKGAVPPGMYKPTRLMGMLFCQHSTPGMVSVRISRGN